MESSQLDVRCRAPLSDSNTNDFQNYLPDAGASQGNAMIKVSGATQRLFDPVIQQDGNSLKRERLHSNTDGHAQEAGCHEANKKHKNVKPTVDPTNQVLRVNDIAKVRGIGNCPQDVIDIEDSGVNCINCLAGCDISAESQISENEPTAFPWQNKCPFIIFGDFTINGTRFPMELLSMDSNHKHYAFKEAAFVQIGKESHDTSKLVLKFSNPLKHRSAKSEIAAITKQMNAYQNLCKEQVPVQKIYADPMTFVDFNNPLNGKFWIVELMAEEITGAEWAGDIPFECLSEKSRRVLNFAKSWLTEMACQEKDIIHNFLKRSTMLDLHGNLKITTFTTPEKVKQNIDLQLLYYVHDWANGNINIAEMLIEDFPENIRDWVWKGINFNQIFDTSEFLFF